MILRGLLLLARGKQIGVKEFGNTPEALAASLAPLIAFPLVGASLSALGGQWQMALLGFCARLCAVLVLPLITFEFARRSGREALWLRTAAALNWSFWMLIPVLFVAILIASMMVGLGIPVRYDEYAALGLAGVYLLLYQWVIVRAGLEVSAIKSAFLVLLSNFIVGIFTAGPVLVQYATTGKFGH